MDKVKAIIKEHTLYVAIAAFALLAILDWMHIFDSFIFDLVAVLLALGVFIYYLRKIVREDKEKENKN